jgi:phytoene dehydrogenase-like protein
MKYDAIVVGGGIAGLTASAYLAKAGYSTMVCEKEKFCGGLVNSFERDGFVYDGGIRAMENSGVLFPMLKQLGLDIEFVKNNISIGIENKVIWVHSEENIADYQNLLAELYPDSKDEINEIIVQIRKIMHYMDVQYGIDNPAFLDMKENREYMLKEILPWMFKYALTFRKIAALNEPVVDFLKRITQNQALLDIITQHFFQETPAFFALSYIKLYLDYYYPLGGTGKVIEKILAHIKDHNGLINTNTEITAVDTEKKRITDSQGNTYQYQRLIWAADLKTLYRLVDLTKIQNNRVRTAIKERQAIVGDKVGNDSVFTSFLGVNLDKSFFANIASEHFFYTPNRTGESVAGPIPVGKSQETIKNWLEKFFALTTYEIACPVMRDETLAPKGKTGLIVSVLFDYQLTKYVRENGWYDAFKSFAETCIINTLDTSIYPGFKDAILHKFSSSPLTLERYTGNANGAITGWSFTNHPMPAEHRLPKIFSATETPIPGVFQAGQWTYSPSGLPISILTGKLAADKVIKDMSKKR